MGNTFNYYVFPEVTPNDESPIQFDPLVGFREGQRKQKVMKVTAAEIESMQIPDEFIDYCLHRNLEWKSCQIDNWPFTRQCAHKLHAYGACRFEEFKDQLRDYERERRIMVRRQKRKQLEKKKQAELLKEQLSA